MISRGSEVRVKALDREAVSAVADGLGASRASATLPLSGNVILGLPSHAQNKSLNNVVHVDGLLDGL